MLFTVMHKSFSFMFSTITATVFFFMSPTNISHKYSTEGFLIAPCLRKDRTRQREAVKDKNTNSEKSDFWKLNLSINIKHVIHIEFCFEFRGILFNVWRNPFMKNNLGAVCYYWFVALLFCGKDNFLSFAFISFLLYGC